MSDQVAMANINSKMPDTSQPIVEYVTLHGYDASRQLKIAYGTLRLSATHLAAQNQSDIGLTFDPTQHHKCTNDHKMATIPAVDHTVALHSPYLPSIGQQTHIIIFIPKGKMAIEV